MGLTDENNKVAWLMGITIFLGVIGFKFWGSVMVYVMVTAIFLEAFFFEENRKSNFWKFLLGYIGCLLFVFFLFNN
ncbi:hypothetical protein FQ085_12630 [Planococcus sp. ANT_H30]|uniref:hypothetical protein n=1 Tax=Planococcus sp. ANT_H30 TaxID=2597347 RepID=UPI0011ECBA9E|nr:hypothetical protein [Planococcus sp. ANT_H30]KAA0956348.1 hypothetical protein FQ085_12630 [Planococcus sp. ANT_H30]